MPRNDKRFSSTPISLLILQELKLMRQDMKDELTKLRQAICENNIGKNNFDDIEKRIQFTSSYGLDLNCSENFTENVPLNIEEPSSEISNEQPALTEAQTIGHDAQDVCGDGLNIKHEIIQEISQHSYNDEQFSDIGACNAFGSLNQNSITGSNDNVTSTTRSVSTTGKVSLVPSANAAKKKSSNDFRIVKTVAPRKNIASTNKKYQLEFSSKHPGTIYPNSNASLDQQSCLLSWQHYNNNYNSSMEITNGGNTDSDEIMNGSKSDRHVKLKYACRECGKRFISVYKKRQHIVTAHHPQPKFVCSYCNKIFISKSILTVHVRRKHTGEKPFSCHICGLHFHCVGDCNHHMKRVHPSHE